MDLHWTGAALLLAIALGPSASRARRPTGVSWSEFARDHGLPTEEPAQERPANGSAPLTASTARPPIDLDPHQPRAATERRAARLRAAAVCGHCGREAGALERDAAATTKRPILRPAGDTPPCVVPAGA